MLKDGFLRYCDDPDIACCRGEAELGRLRIENARRRADLERVERERDAAIADIKCVPSIWPCYACKHTGQMSDRCHKNDRECFEWRGASGQEVHP